MPAKTSSYSVEALKGQAVMKQLRETVTDIQTSIGHRMFEIAATFVLLNLVENYQPKTRSLMTRN